MTESVTEPKIITYIEDDFYHVLELKTQGIWKGKWDYAGDSPILPSSIKMIPGSEKMLSTQIQCKSDLGAILNSKPDLFSQAVEYAKTFNADYALLNSEKNSNRLPKRTEIEKGLWNVEERVVLYRKK
jgi:hypothetical protein